MKYNTLKSLLCTGGKIFFLSIALGICGAAPFVFAEEVNETEEVSGVDEGSDADEGNNADEGSTAREGSDANIAIDIDAQLALFTEDLKDGMTDYNDENLTSGPYYYITDLDHDGLLELNIGLNSSEFSHTFEIRIYEVNETMDGITLMSDTGADGEIEFAPDTFYDIENDTSIDMFYPTEITGYYDASTDSYYYYMFDNNRIDMSSTQKYFLVHLTADKLELQELGTNYMGLDGTTWTLADGTSLSGDQEFKEALESYVEGYTPVTNTGHYFYFKRTEGSFADYMKESAEEWLYGAVQ